MTTPVDFDHDPFWVQLRERIDSPVKQRCFEDLQSYYRQLCDRLEPLSPGDPQRLALMVDINRAMAAMRALTDLNDEEISRSHAQFLAEAAAAGFTI
ncbi:MAG: hypothetical protein H6970_00765 [Gammaproteobacteria bacterium]|nr:hypothetical protein [Gammaproteobacteria bacterium]MCP5423591.1 hypothetical protein [Gammaproteobacteria bacterium]MCP5459835.1 hypothetical protein [Gammaproteobacteria bacterium]